MFTQLNGQHYWNETFINNIEDIGNLCQTYYKQDNQGMTIFTISQITDPWVYDCEYLLLKSRIWKPTKWGKFAVPENCRNCHKSVNHLPAWDITGHDVWHDEDRSTYDDGRCLWLCKACICSVDHFPFNGKVATNPNDVKLKHLLQLNNQYYFFYQYHISLHPIKRYTLDKNFYDIPTHCRLCLEKIEPEYYQRHYCDGCYFIVNITYDQLIISFMHISKINIIDDIKYYIKNIFIQFA